MRSISSAAEATSRLWRNISCAISDPSRARKAFNSSRAALSAFAAITNTSFYETDLHGANVGGLDLSGSTIDRVDCRNIIGFPRTLPPNYFVQYNSLWGAGCELIGVNYSQAVLEGLAVARVLPPNVDPDSVVTGGMWFDRSNFSGADLSNLVNEAAILSARRNKKTIAMPEFEEALERIVAGPERIESGWWDGADVKRDYFIARTPREALVWVYRERQAGWYLHGIFS